MLFTLQELNHLQPVQVLFLELEGSLAFYIFLSLLILEDVYIVLLIKRRRLGFLESLAWHLLWVVYDQFIIFISLILFHEISPDWHTVLILFHETFRTFLIFYVLFHFYIIRVPIRVIEDILRLLIIVRLC